MENKTVEPLLTSKEIMAFLGVKKSFFYRDAEKMRQQGLPIFKIGKEWRASKQQMEAWIQKQSKVI